MMLYLIPPLSPRVDGLELKEEDKEMIQPQGEKKSDSPDGERRGRGKKKEWKGVVSDDSDRSLSSQRDGKSPVKNLSMLIPVKKTMEETDEVKTKIYYETIANRLEQQGQKRTQRESKSQKMDSDASEEELRIKRKEKEAKKASLAVDSVFGKEESSSDSSSSKSTSPNKEDLAAKRLVQCLEELKLARLSRFKLARFVHAPFFNKTMIDCYVRMGIAQVIDVVEAAKVITWSQRKLINNQEFQEWMSTMKRHNRSLPTMGEIHKKMKDMASPGEHNYTNDEVNQLAESLRGEMAREMEGITSPSASSSSANDNDD
ncbi:hypothetical protein PRIPAC_96506 [Pristionchus pacificus]|uniref:Plus3 domain-containing protein n=1 Tax=Pristionchus pacificus TaxID=54126 RepID=A0A2A6BDK7_PRIPA|nr:hypothetical protein PRIPAC_96506 [Pristionchus pacificus]|eukprot:PDM63959.1 hypothetical protein PRIPAC_49460 [Pristionchus pacificus]